jgi:chromosomal replication initiation ATPase DnaA
MNKINQLEMIAAILNELANQGCVYIDQGTLNVIVTNVDNLIRELEPRLVIGMDR